MKLFFRICYTLIAAFLLFFAANSKECLEFNNDIIIPASNLGYKTEFNISNSMENNLSFCISDDEKSITDNVPDYLAIYNEQQELAMRSFIIDDFPMINQFPDFPTGCESVAAVMVLNYYRHDITVGDFVDNYLEKSLNFYTYKNKFYGPDPNKYFIGNPRSNNSFGCMSNTIGEAVSKIIGKDNVTVLSGVSLDELSREYIFKSKPVLVWVSVNMVEFEEGTSWWIDDNTKFTWPKNEHCMVLIGYDETHYYFSDPYVGKTVKHTKERSENRFLSLGSQSVIINNSNP